jgi:hypothetical protein
MNLKVGVVMEALVIQKASPEMDGKHAGWCSHASNRRGFDEEEFRDMQPYDIRHLKVVHT